MQSERKAKINGEIILGEDCNFDDLVKDIFACFENHNAKPNFRMYEILQEEDRGQMYYGIRKNADKYVMITSEKKEGLINIFKCIKIFEGGQENEAQEYLDKMNAMV